MTALENSTIIAQSVLFILAGFDTTSNSIITTTHNVAKYQHVQDKLREELQTLVNNNDDGELNYQNIMEAPYLDAVVAGEFWKFFGDIYACTVYTY